MILSNRKGFVLPTVIFAITVMSVIAVVALTTASDERRTSRATRESTLAMYAAEAGLRQTHGAWPAGAQSLQPGDSLDLGWQTLPNKAAYRTVIHRVDQGGLQEYDVIVQGRRTDPTAGIITIAGSVGGVPIFSHAVSGESGVKLANGGIFDGYDSERGPYFAATADSTANLRSGGDISISLTLLKGGASAAGAVSLGLLAFVTGDTSSGAPAAPPMDILPCPSGGFTPAAKVPTGAGISYSAVTGALHVSGGATLTLADTSYFFSSIVLTNNSNLVVLGASAAKIILLDSLNAAGGNVINQSAKPPTLSFESCGASATPGDWSLNSGGSPGYFTVYAPNHAVFEHGAGDFHGAIVADSYYATGGGRFHYDAALARQPSYKLQVQPGSWAQLAGT